MRKKISQREAVRTRRELKRLREFVDTIVGVYQTAPKWEVARISVGERTQGRFSGYAAAAHRPVFLARVDNDTAYIFAAQVPHNA